MGIVFSAACSLSLTLPLYSNGSGLVSCVALALPLGVLVFVVLSLLARFSFKPGECERSRNRGTRLFAFAAVSFIAIWVVLGLAPLYPGCFSTDSIDILKMVSGMPFESDHFRYDTLNNHHPAAYVFLIYIIYNACMLFGFSQATSAAIVAFAHLFVLALCCGFIVRKVSELFLRPALTLACFAFLLWDPLLVWYSVTVWKDVVFSGLFVCFALLLVDIKVNPKQYAAHPLRGGRAAHSVGLLSASKQRVHCRYRDHGDIRFCGIS